jgi:hypothetical protein
MAIWLFVPAIFEILYTYHPQSLIEEWGFKVFDFSGALLVESPSNIFNVASVQQT